MNPPVPIRFPIGLPAFAHAPGFGAGIRTAVGQPGGAGVMVVCGLGMLWLSLLETLVSPIARASFGWDLQQISVFFAAFAGVAAVLMVAVGVASKCLLDRTLVAASIFFYVLAIAMFFFYMPAADHVGLTAFGVTPNTALILTLTLTPTSAQSHPVPKLRWKPEPYPNGR